MLFIFLPLCKGSSAVSGGIFLILVLLACLKKLALIANIVAIERDWVRNFPLSLSLVQARVVNDKDQL
jgi:hypothetical protein